MPNILDLLKRPQLKRQQDEQERAEKKKRGGHFVRNAKWYLLIFANAVALFFDVLAMDGVWQATQDYVLTALILLPTGVPLILWEFGWLYPLASPEQKNRAVKGVVRSVVSAVLIGLASIAQIIGVGGTWPMFIMLGLGVIFVVWHGYDAARYFYDDPEIKRNHELQVATAENDYQQETIQSLNAMLNALEPVLKREQELRAKYGDATVNVGIERLMGIRADAVSKGGKGQGEQGQQNQSKNQQPPPPPAGERRDTPASENGKTQPNPTEGVRK